MARLLHRDGVSRCDEPPDLTVKAARDHKPDPVAMDHDLIQLRRELSQLRKQARHNELIWSGFREIEIDAISADSLHELSYRIVRGIRRAFPRVHYVTLACVNLDYEIANILLEGDERYKIEEAFMLLSQDKLEQIASEVPKPWLGPLSRGTHAALFSQHDSSPASVALAPLRVAGSCIGFLCQGSRSQDHFAAGTSTELLEHLASTIALCVQNTVNKARLERYGLTDPLTGIANRRLLMRRLQEEVDRCRRYDHSVACVMVDLDHFKQINDRYGHQVGDQVLVDVSNVLKRGLRSSDLLSRYGGEEFVVLLPETTREQAAQIAKRHLREIRGLQLVNNKRQSFLITASIGVAELRSTNSAQSVHPGSLIEEADAALYKAKRAGRNRVVVAKLGKG